MRLVYLILAHRGAEQLRVLVDTLAASGRAGVYVHVDAKTASEGFVSALRDTDVRFVTPPVRTTWGGFSIVQATLNGLRTIVEAERGPYYLVLLSGQDFPAKPTSVIEAFFEDTPWSACLQFARMGEPGAKPAERYERYWLHNELRVRGAYRLEQLLSRILPRRRLPAGVEPFAGEQWWSAREDVVEYIVDYVDRHKAYRRFFRWTEVPDESFFHTIIMNSPFKDRVHNDHLRYVDWSTGHSSPRELTRDDIGRIIQSSALFARKFSDVATVKELARYLTVED